MPGLLVSISNGSGLVDKIDIVTSIDIHDILDILHILSRYFR